MGRNKKSSLFIGRLKRALPAGWRQAFCAPLAAQKDESPDTFVMVDIGYLDDEQYGDDNYVSSP